MAYTLINKHGMSIISNWLTENHIDGTMLKIVLDYADDAETLKANYLPCILIITANEAKSGHVESLLLDDVCFENKNLEDDDEN